MEPYELFLENYPWIFAFLVIILVLLVRRAINSYWVPETDLILSYTLACFPNIDSFSATKHTATIAKIGVCL